MVETKDVITLDCTPDPKDSDVLYCKIRPSSDQATVVDPQSRKEKAVSELPNTPVATPPNDPIETWTRSDAGQKGSEMVTVRRVKKDGKELFEIIKPRENPEPKANGPSVARTRVSRFGGGGKTSCKLPGTHSIHGRQDDQTRDGGS